MSTPKLVLCFAAAGAKYDDCRVPATAFEPSATGNQTEITWPGFKGDAPYGQLPVLIVEGHKIAQSAAIVRYVATRYGLMGLGAVEAAIVDATLEQVRDLSDAFGKIQALPKDEQAAARAKFVSELGEKAASLEAQLKANHGGSNWIVGNNLTAADLAILRVFGNFRGAAGAEFAKACPPLLQALIARVEKLPNVAAHLASRPVRPF